MKLVKDRKNDDFEKKSWFPQKMIITTHFEATDFYHK